MNEKKYTNNLINQKSPYLLQHAYNPVNWYPWSEEAFQKATQEDKPIFLSIGYSTCHWCHVMERESFENDEVADILNKKFISIKVDREERPDIDNIYMTVCQAMTGHGGWPLTVILTPDKKPFYAGTYFPKNDRMGMPGLMTILERISDAWKNKRKSLENSGDRVTDVLNQYDSPARNIPEEVIDEAYADFKQSYDSAYGGFGYAPKFPTPHNLYFLIRYWYVQDEIFALKMVEETLDSMYRGGIYDHIGFGFSRYSTDEKWLVPHFEKMLYDNALLAIAYIETYLAVNKKKYSEVAEQIFTYVLRDMTSSEGGFFSAEDADSEGVEGKFYVWTPEEVRQVLGDDDGNKFCEYYDISPEGNFDGKSIPNLISRDIPEDSKIFFDKCRVKLFHHREKRVHPFKDDKILTSWNGLMIAALSIGGRTLNCSRYIDAAEKATGFIFKNMIREDGRLLARYRDGEASYPGYIDDYAFLIWGLIELYESTYKAFYLQKALDLSNDLLKLFWDNNNGGLFLYGNDSEQLITRPKEVYDGATPSGNSVAALNFLKLARITGQHELEEKAEEMFKTFGGSVLRAARGHSFLLTALLFSYSPSRNIVFVGSNGNNNDEPMVQEMNKEFRPFTLSLNYSDEYRDLKKIVPFVKNYEAVNGKITAYVCENFSCQAPVTDTRAFIEKLKIK